MTIKNATWMSITTSKFRRTGQKLNEIWPWATWKIIFPFGLLCVSLEHIGTQLGLVVNQIQLARL